MIYPIVAYGDSVLRKKAVDISVDYPNLKQLVDDMFETMKSSSGVGLAAPQIGLSIRLFLVDSIAILESYAEDDENDFEGEVGIRKAFFNAKIIQRAGDPWQYNEGCLSIPKIREDILRPEEIVIEYQDENFKTITETYSGLYDDAKTTVKETTIHDNNNGNLIGPNETYSGLYDNAKTTMKETMIHDDYTGNIKVRELSYVKNNDKTKTTLRQTLPIQDTTRNINNVNYKTNKNHGS